jgi:glycine cleavage system H lipoate-binding protein
VGLTKEVRAQVGRVTRFRGPSPGTFHRQGEPLISLESEKWVGHFSNPLDGTVTEVNEAWYRDPSALGACPLEDAWFYRLLPKAPLVGTASRPRAEGGFPEV